MKDRKSVKKLYRYVQEEFNKELVHSKEYKEILKRRVEKEELLENCISGDVYKMFQEYIEVQNEMESFDLQEAFIKGFTIAYQLFIDSIK